ncbi:MAG: UDP-N-acetylglucosamine 4-epimerase [Chlamydiia bacterium]|nr:UDP-N-acetylglucosamine 4-epimerase [Chlamydiia bacterium]
MRTQPNIFITGICGFIGTHLALRLVEQGYRVFGLDAMLSPLAAMRKEKLLEKDVTLYPIDLVDISTLQELFETTPFSHVIHLAAQAGVRASQTHPEKFVHSNLVGFTALLEFVKQFDIPLLYASSSSVYGAIEGHASKETDPTSSPLSFYGSTKKANEVMAYSYHNLYNMRMCGMRFFTVYGPMGRPDMAYYKFANRIVNDEPITLYEPEKMARDFTYIDDIIDGIVKLLDVPFTYDIYNLGKGSPDSLLEMVSLLETYLEKKADIRIEKKPAGDVYRTSCDITFAKKQLNYHPTTSLKEGLKRFCNWYQTLPTRAIT